MSQAKIALRLGLAFVFLYAGTSALLSPADWLWYIPEWMQKIVPGELQLMGHSIFEIGLALWILSGWKTKFAAGVAALDLLAITLVNISVLSVVFRDIGLFAAAVALFFLYNEKA